RLKSPAKAMVYDRPQLTARQRDILRHAVEEYIQTGQPVGSRYLVERAGLSVSASPVRTELAELERLGLLTHPHTSAGRVPTEEGYRLFVQGLLDRIEPRAASAPPHPPAPGAGGRRGPPGRTRDRRP